MSVLFFRCLSAALTSTYNWFLKNKNEKNIYSEEKEYEIPVIDYYQFEYRVHRSIDVLQYQYAEL